MSNNTQKTEAAIWITDIAFAVFIALLGAGVMFWSTWSVVSQNVF